MGTLSTIAIIFFIIAINMLFLLMPSIIFKRAIGKKSNKDEKLKILDQWLENKPARAILYSFPFILAGILSYIENYYRIAPNGETNYSVFIGFVFGVPIMQYFQIKNLYIENYKLPIFRVFFIFTFILIISAIIGGQIHYYSFTN